MIYRERNSFAEIENVNYSFQSQNIQQSILFAEHILCLFEWVPPLNSLSTSRTAIWSFAAATFNHILLIHKVYLNRNTGLT